MNSLGLPRAIQGGFYYFKNLPARVGLSLLAAMPHGAPRAQTCRSIPNGVCAGTQVFAMTFQTGNLS